MQWSRLKRNIESFFADSVKGRVGLHSTRYRTMHDHDGRAWITLDGEEIVNMVHVWKWLRRVDQRATSLAGKSVRWHHDDPRVKAAEAQLEDECIFTQSHLGGAMHEYQSLSIADILESDNPIIRAIGMLDRRVGIRRLRKIDGPREHALVRATHMFRCRAEGICGEQAAHPT